MPYEFYQNTLTVPASTLIEEEIMTESNYKLLCHRGKIVRVREGKGLGNYALVDFNSLPERFRVDVVKILGYPPKKEVQHQILKHYTTDYEAVDFFATYKIDDYRTLSPEHQEQYCADAQMLHALNIYIKEMEMFRKSRGGSIAKVWDEAVKAISEVKEQTGHNLPGTARRLKEKLEDFLKDGYKSLISKKFLTQNAAKIVEPQEEAVMRKLLRQYQNYDNEFISQQWNKLAPLLDFKPVSAATVGNYKKKFKLSTISFSQGKKEFNKTFRMQVKRKAPEFPFAYWSMDGWDVELLYQKFENGKTTYHNRLTIYVVLDPSKKYPIGYAIGDRENTELIKAALRNAVQHSEELFGFKHKPYQIQADNYQIKTMAPVYKGVAKNFIPTTVGNAQAKVIEPWFNFFNKTYCRTQPNWSGFGVKAKTNINNDFLQANKKNFPTKEQCFEQVVKLIEQARKDAKDEFVQAYENAPQDLKALLPEVDYYKFLGVKKPKTTKLEGHGIVFDIKKIEYSFDSFDVNFRKKSHLDWEIFFAPENMERVLAHNPQQNLSFMLEEKYVQPMDLYSQEREDQLQHNRVKAFNMQMMFEIMNENSEDAEIIKETVFDLPEIPETLQKMLITDSRGQHKDRRNEKRIANAQKKIENYTKEAEKNGEEAWNREQDEYLKNRIDLNKYLEND